MDRGVLAGSIPRLRVEPACTRVFRIGLLPHIKESVHKEDSLPLSSAAAGWLGSVFMFGYYHDQW